ERLLRWNDDWLRGSIAYGSGPEGSGARCGLPGYGFALPRWSDDVAPVAWYREGRAIAAHLADELAGVKVRLVAARYVCALRFLHLTRIFDDDEFFSPVEA